MTEEEYDLEIGACEQFILTVNSAVRKLSVTTEMPLGKITCIQEEITNLIENYIQDYMDKLTNSMPKETEYATYKEHLTL